MSPDFSQLPNSPALRWTVVILGFVRDVVASMAWPTAWIFRRPIGELLDRVRSVKAAGVEIEAGSFESPPTETEPKPLKTTDPVSPVTIPERAAPRAEP